MLLAYVAELQLQAAPAAEAEWEKQAARHMQGQTVPPSYTHTHTHASPPTITGSTEFSKHKSSLNFLCFTSLKLKKN